MSQKTCQTTHVPIPGWKQLLKVLNFIWLPQHSLLYATSDLAVYSLMCCQESEKENKRPDGSSLSANDVRSMAIILKSVKDAIDNLSSTVHGMNASVTSLDQRLLGLETSITNIQTVATPAGPSLAQNPILSARQINFETIRDLLSRKSDNRTPHHSFLCVKHGVLC